MGKKDGKNQGKNDGKDEGYSAKPMNPLKYAKKMMRAYNKQGMNALNRYETQAQNQYENYANQMDSIYGAVSAAMPQIASSFQPIYQGASEGYNQALANIAPMAAIASPSENAAAYGYMGTMGGAGQGLLASQLARAGAYGESAARQAPIDQATAKANALTELQQLLDDIAQQKLDIASEARAQLPSYVQQGREFNLALLEYLLREKALEGQLSGYDAANQYMAASLQGPNKGQGNDQTGANPGATLGKSWLQGSQKWAALSPKQQKLVRQWLDSHSQVAEKLVPALGGRTSSMELPELIKWLNTYLQTEGRRF